MSPPTTTTIEIWTRSLRLLFLKELSTLLSLPKQRKSTQEELGQKKKKKKKRINLGEGGGRRGEGEVDEDGDLDQIRVEKVAHKGVQPTAFYGCPWGKNKVDKLRQEESWSSIIKLLPLHSPPPPRLCISKPPRFIHPSIHTFIHQLID
jgi:hypothetical protein